MARTQTVAKAVNDEGQPLLAVAQRRVGLRKAFQALTFMSAWDMVRAAGHAKAEPTIEDYAAYWKISPATAYREQRLFREAFPGEASPTRLLELAAEQANSREPVGALLGKTTFRAA